MNPDGSPQYPDRVIGTWYCWGFHVGNGGATVTGPWVINHQFYDFGEKVGRMSLTSAGLELVDVGVPIKRAITGGIGPFDEARGEVHHVGRRAGLGDAARGGIRTDRGRAVAP